MSSSLKELYNVCNPIPLRGDQIADLAVERADLGRFSRPDVVVPRTLELLEDEDPKILIFGSRGSGKSTELARTEQQLGSRYLIVGLNLSQNQIEREALTAQELLLLCGAAVAKAAQEVWGLDLGDELAALDTVFQKLQPADAAIRLSIGDLMSGLLLFGTTLLDPSGITNIITKNLANLTGSAVDWRIKIGGFLRPSVDRRPTLALLDAVNLIIEAVKKKGPRGPLLLIDELDKIDDDGQSFLLLTHDDLLPSLKCPVVATAPNTLRKAARLRELQDRNYHLTHLHHIRCRNYDNPNGDMDENGLAMLSEMLRRRIRMVSPDCSLVEESALRNLVEASGGVVRDLIKLLQLAALHARFDDSHTIQSSHATSACRELRRQYEMALTGERREELRRTRDQKDISGQPLSIELLEGNLILSYSNGRMWYYPHSIILHLL